MLTTTVDGLWVLQVLTRLEVISPELGLRPHIPSVESVHHALMHPVALELLESGVIDQAGVVDPAVVEWLTVLARRDVALLTMVSTPADAAPVRALLARFGQWWVSIERADDLVRIAPAGVASAEGDATALIGQFLERICGAAKPAPLRPVTLDADLLTAGTADIAALRSLLLDQRIEADQLRFLMLAADAGKSAAASIVALQSGVEGARNRTYVEPGTVTVIDTPEGRILTEQIPRGGKRWVVIGPGNPANIATAVGAMLRRLPAEESWFSYRKVV
ncbi:ESX secretion-associated protein EspG [Mycolicibacterium litorale]|nr:ESX secretion-associated protein EspG [Mycolicibacterium litorale]